MAFCSSCGTEVGPDVASCPSCGASIAPTAAPAAGAGVAPPPPPPPPPAPVTATSGPRVSQWGTLADWGPRALGFLIDVALIIAAEIIFFILALIIKPLIFLVGFVGLGGWVFMAWQIGEFGQTPGMRVVGLRCINNQSGQLLGFGMGVVRGLACIVNSIICYVGWFFPLWDNERQTVADKIMSTYVITVPKQDFSLVPPK